MVAIYTRQSVERADSISVEQQAQLCRDALPAGEVQACKVYTDKGFSGKNIDRPALQRLLADAEAGQIEKILVYRLDRISRSVHDFTGLCASLSARGVHFQSCLLYTSSVGRMRRRAVWRLSLVSPRGNFV